MPRPRSCVRRWRSPRVAVPVVAAALLAAGVPAGLALERTGVRISGVRPGALVGATALSGLTLRVSTAGAPASRVRLALDGRPVPGRTAGSALVYRPGTLPDGRHTLTARLPGRLGLGGATASRSFTVDTTPPRLAVSAPASAPSLRRPVTVSGRADGARTVSAAGRDVPVRDGRFSVTFPTPPADARIVARDAAGNTATATVSVPVRLPRMRGVHMTGYAWAYAGLRDPVLRLVRDGKINMVELDIKEEDGKVNYASSVPLARRAGAIRDLYDPRKVIARLHRMGVTVVGRIVAFRDPVLAGWAWRNGRRDWVVQTPGGAPYASTYGAISFTNLASPAVRRYNEDLAAEAARLGFDSVMYDYVRRPDGPRDGMAFPGLTGPPAAAVAGFVRETRARVRPLGAFLGAAVFGVSATRPDEVAQDIPAMARYLDYVSPMVYPSHWAPGEYGVADPNGSPYAIVNRSLKDFQAKVAGTDAQVVPWLQDFSLGRTYGPAQVRAQIQAAADDGIDSFVLWNAASSYTSAALARTPGS